MLKFHERERTDLGIYPKKTQYSQQSRPQRKTKVEINMHHLPKAMQYRQAPWAILTKICFFFDRFLSLSVFFSEFLTSSV